MAKNEHSKNGRKQNKQKIDSILNAYRAAWEIWIVRNDENLEELYDGKEFLPFIHSLSPVDEIKLLLEYRRRKGNMDLSQVEEQIVDWHEQLGLVLEPLSPAPRKDRILVCEIAAAIFNAQLARDQKGDTRLGIEPCRLGERKATWWMIQRALNRLKNG